MHNANLVLPLLTALTGRCLSAGVCVHVCVRNYYVSVVSDVSDVVLYFLIDLKRMKKKELI